MKADLHVHTIHSDGVCYVGEIIELAKKRGLAAVAVTDHDVLQGALEAEKLSTQELKVIVGLELSTEYKGESVHILGYFKDGSGLEAFERFWPPSGKTALSALIKSGIGLLSISILIWTWALHRKPQASRGDDRQGDHQPGAPLHAGRNL